VYIWVSMIIDSRTLNFSRSINHIFSIVSFMSKLFKFCIKLDKARLVPNGDLTRSLFLLTTNRWQYIVNQKTKVKVKKSCKNKIKADGLRFSY
jgi:transcription antitermination factor NusG